jgi:DNA-binding NtrC family response regulator
MNYEDISVLVVDDYMIIRKLVSKQLNAMGVSAVDTAENAEDAKNRMADKKFDIVFLDWAMPGKSGLALLKECRQDRNFDDTAFIMLTAEAQKSAMIEAVKAGTTLYIIKPMSYNVLGRKIDEAIDWLQKQKAGEEGTAHA